MGSFRSRIYSFLYNVAWLFYQPFKSLSVARTICVSFGLAIFGGGVLLFLSDYEKLSFVNALYLSFSAFCVTGLSPVDLSTLSFTSQFLIMIYIQLGGLGIIVFTVLIGLMVIQGLSRNTKLKEFVAEVLDTNLRERKEVTPYESSSPDIWRVIISIFNITVSLELLGALFLYIFLPHDLPYNVSRGFLSFFLSISAFNNAGFSITNDLAFLTKNVYCLYIISSLIILGGIGYPVMIFIEKSLLELLFKVVSKLEIQGETYLMRQAIKGEEPSKMYFLFTKLSLWTEYRIESYNKALFGESNRVQTNIIIYGTAALLLLGTSFVMALEFANPETLGSLSLSEKLANSVLMSASSRTAGFNTFPVGKILDPTIILICCLMFIGGGPQGTAGGIKITTFAILVKYLGNVISSASNVAIFGNTISKRSVAMSIRLYFLATSTLAAVIFVLTVLHRDQGRIPQIIFEVISAFGTVGFSLGITTVLTDAEKLIYCVLMYIGRIGIFTVLIAMTGNPVTSPIGQDDGVKIQVG